jgi:hypothetical protein
MLLFSESSQSFLLDGRYVATGELSVVKGQAFATLVGFVQGSFGSGSVDKA